MSLKFDLLKHVETLLRAATFSEIHLKQLIDLFTVQPLKVKMSGKNNGFYYLISFCTWCK